MHMTKLLTSVVASVLVVAAFSISGSAQKGGRERFDPSGTFWIIGDPPSDFSDFSAINLNTRRLRWLPSSGVQLNNGRSFRFKQVVVKQDTFTFTTTQVRGASYSFSGRFLKGGVFAEAVLDDQTPVLEGILTKFAAGKKVAEAKLKFGYFGGT
jgi:hypothetical protein